MILLLNPNHSICILAGTLLFLSPIPLNPTQIKTTLHYTTLAANMLNFQSPILLLLTISHISASTIYEVLKSNGLPMGLFPKGVTNFTIDNDSGRFEVHLDEACNAKFEDELHYDCSVVGNLTYGQIGGLSGISAQDLFLWFPVKEIRVDIPSSGLIYFDVGVVSKQFSLSSFETPRECFPNHQLIAQTVPKILSRKFGIINNI